MSRYAFWYSRLVWIGIVLNMLFVIPLALHPGWFLRLLKIPLDQLIWGQTAAMTLFIITVFYMPAASDPTRYRVVAWMHVFPARICGGTFFLVAVLFFGQPLGFLSIALVDLFFGLTTLYCLVQITREEAGKLQQSLEQETVIPPQWPKWLAMATILILLMLFFGLTQ
jgi:hypothetical protein